jgi:hypothetical protein
MPVKLSDELVKLARKEATAADRSITAQIEHWAKLGRSVESALAHDDLAALKRAEGDLKAAYPVLSTRQAMYALLGRVAAANDRSELARTLTQGRVVYQSDPKDPRAIVRIEPDGRRTIGRLEKRRFVAGRPSRRRVGR